MSEPLKVPPLPEAAQNLQTFNIYRHPRLGTEAVKVGFSWPALFFGFLWMLLSKLWLQSGLYFVGLLIIVLLGIFLPQGNYDYYDNRDGTSIAEIMQALAALALTIIPAISGNEWRENNLIKRGFEHVKTIKAQNKESALSQIAV